MTGETLFVHEPQPRRSTEWKERPRTSAGVISSCALLDADVTPNSRCCRCGESRLWSRKDQRDEHREFGKIKGLKERNPKELADSPTHSAVDRGAQAGRPARPGSPRGKIVAPRVTVAGAGGFAHPKAVAQSFGWPGALIDGGESGPALQRALHDDFFCTCHAAHTGCASRPASGPLRRHSSVAPIESLNRAITQCNHVIAQSPNHPFTLSLPGLPDLLVFCSPRATCGIGAVIFRSPKRIM